MVQLNLTKFKWPTILNKTFSFLQLRREKIDLENTLEQEQEALVNRLWKRMDKLEAEKRLVQSCFLVRGVCMWLDYRSDVPEE